MFKYRAKRLDGDGGWIQGKSIQYFDDGTIYLEKDCSKSKLPNFMCPIDPSTLGVSWGMKDKNGKDVYTGMRVRMLWQHDGSTNYDFEFVGKVIFVNDRSEFMVMDDKNEVAMPFYSFEREELFPEEIEIIEEE